MYKWQCWYQVQSKQWRTVGVAELNITSILKRDIFELTSCPECKGYDPRIVRLSLHLSSWMGYFHTCSCDVFPQSRSISDAKIFASDLFLESGNSIPRSLYDK